jgi:lipoprotein-anchoring transpeptidase ErfK/SrfK
MTKRFALFCAISSTFLIAPHITMAAPTALRQAAAPTPSPGSYGGGFLELFLTGTASAPGPATAAAVQTGQAASSDAVQRGIDPIYLRQEVEFKGPERPGTIVIDTPNKYLFLVEKGGRALRYGIGVGRPGFSWSGVKTISRKAEWPAWTPPPQMLKRRPDLPTHMVGGPDNPLGARALYLGSSLYRIHGTNEPYSIGTNVSSGCIRMMNSDVIDLYGRVRVGTKVIVI